MRNVTIPIKLINLLTDGKFHSNKQFGMILGISRVDVNRYIRMICDWGVNVFQVPNKGYCLCTPLQLLSKNIICANLPAGRLAVLAVIDSTNQYLIDRIGTMYPGDACVAEYQTQGRGRRGRQWVSPFGNNLCLSLYWRLEQGLAVAVGLNVMVSIVVAKILKRLGAEDIRLKWPNDLYLNDRKLGGILVEISGKTCDVAHIVIGIGINLVMCANIDSKINQGWISLQEVGIVIDRNILVAVLISELRQALRQFEHSGFKSFISHW